MAEPDVRIIILALYFGKIPETFPVWELSCSYNKDIDFLLFTDQSIETKTSNISIVKVPFGEITDIVNRKLGMKCKLDRSYKLCDFKPMYGVIFDDYISGYDYWGHCDLDMVFGNLRKYFNEYCLSAYDKFMHLGHLSLYKNTEDVNRRYMKNGSKVGNWYSVVTTGRSCCFDEWRGMYKIYKLHNYPMFDSHIFADVSTANRRIQLAFMKNYEQQVVCWERGNVYRYYYENECIKRDEFIYVHIQKRKLKMEGISEGTERFLITPDKCMAVEAEREISLEIIETVNPFPGVEYEEMEVRSVKRRRKNRQRKEKILRLPYKLKCVADNVVKLYKFRQI